MMEGVPWHAPLLRLHCPNGTPVHFFLVSLPPSWYLVSPSVLYLLLVNSIDTMQSSERGCGNSRLPRVAYWPTFPFGIIQIQAYLSWCDREDIVIHSRGNRAGSMFESAFSGTGHICEKRSGRRHRIKFWGDDFQALGRRKAKIKFWGDDFQALGRLESSFGETTFKLWGD